MKIFRADQVKQIDAYTIENEPVRSIDLMERAAFQLYRWLVQRYSRERKIKIYVGPGNNGGDGLALARMLAEDFYQVEVFYVKFTDKVTKDWKINYDRLAKQDKADVRYLVTGERMPVTDKQDLLVDGLFGSGLSRPLDGFPAEVVRSINKHEGEIIAIDIPSGLMGEDNSGNKRSNIVNATITLTFQFPNLSFFYAENEIFVGEWHLLPIGLHQDIIRELQTGFFYLTPDLIRSNMGKRKKFSHKGNFGHVLLISGCYGKMGAAILASRACLRTGTGLLTTHIPKFGYGIIQTALPEAMISIDQSDIIFTLAPDLEPYQAIGVGPAIGCRNNSHKALHDLIERAGVPIVFDADAINILGENRKWLNSVPAGSIFTPHPKEFERLVGKSKNHFDRNMKQIAFAKKYNVYLVLKGAFTSVACPDGSCYFNSTGNPGMATAGSGDVLTGIILSLLGQGYSPKLSALIGVYIHGLAGDIARDQYGEEALIATDIIENLGNAFKEIRKYE
ncbi:MAG: NAD(P)H-hydrate dehydratase [Bacteroidales bacterium]|nr:MAG: NAD(P)H-hydrate dehydratase [Bacteroidales bacterium]